MKKSIKYLAIALFLLITTGCTKDVVDLLPASSIAYENAFDTPERILLNVIGCYDAAQSGFYPGNNQRRGYPFGAAYTEQGDMRGEDMVNVQAFFAYTYEGTFNDSSPNGQAMWECTYQMINKINIVIDGINNAVTRGIITQQVADQYIAECRFLRAMGFHVLLIHFARPYNFTADASHFGIPISIAPINTIELVEVAKQAGRATCKASYEQMISDLEYAIANLNENRSGGAKISRATKGAAIAALMRVYQHMGEYGKVLTEGNKIISAAAPFTSPIGGYKLTEQPEGPFANNSANTESMWSIEHSALDNATNNGSLSQFYSTVRRLVSVSPIVLNANWWLASDLRRSQLLVYDADDWWSYKYRAGSAMTDWAPIIRYAEAILIQAEAEARINGVTPKAVALLNAVRNRAVKAVADQYTVASFANVMAFMDALIKERRIEFLGEGKRWEDIHRLSTDPTYFIAAHTGAVGVGVPGVPDRVTYANISTITGGYNVASGVVPAGLLTTMGFPASDRRFLFPIPQSETSANEKIKTQQNPEW
jgi:SusD family.